MSTARAPEPELQGERGFVANSWLVAKREFRERVRSKLFAVSTLFLAFLAVTVALMPILIRAVGRDSTTSIAVASSEADLTNSSIAILETFLNPTKQKPPPYTFVAASPSDDLAGAVYDGRYAGALVATRDPNGKLLFQMLTGESLGTDKVTQVQIGVLAIGVLDYIKHNPTGLAGSAVPDFIAQQVGASAAGGGAGTVDPGEFAGRRIVGVVSVVLIFITVVIYGMWVAAGVVAEKSSRVMELLISAATPEQLVIGKVAGMGLAGLLQYAFILVPALSALLLQDKLSALILGPGNGVPVSLAALTPGLLAAYGAFWVLGFILYALVYAAAGSLVSRAEDLQVLALPLSMIAIAGYGTAVLALGGGIGPLVRFASFVPFWSPFVMLTRLTVGRVEPWELVLSLGLLVAAIPIVAVIAVRVYSAGVLLYGQRPGARQIVGAILNPPA
jgi:ABC-2 type transport system permease protein